MPSTQKTLPVAIVIGSGFDEKQFTEAQRYFLLAEIAATVISVDGGLAQGWHQDMWGHHFMADESLSDVLCADYRALLLVGGARSSAVLVGNPHAKRFVQAFVQGAKPVGAVGEAVTLLADAEVVAGRRVTSMADNRAALEEAGAVWSDTQVVDGMLLTAGNDVHMRAFLDDLVGLTARADGAMEAA